MFTYEITSGELLRGSTFIGTGYSGLKGEWRNNPAMESVPEKGPIPRGKYKIGPCYQHPQLGPIVMNLEPMPGTNTFGRSLFRIHGDNINHDASHGCIILGPSIRRQIAISGDEILEVV